MARETGQLYTVAHTVLQPLFGALWNIEIEGEHHIPDTGAAIFAPNHASVFDSFLLPAVLSRRITYVGKAEYMDDWKTKHLFPALGMIPIDRTGGDAAERALSAAERVLQRGEFFGIYPEGTRARSGQLHKGHTGPARLALRTGAPIIPVGLVGTRDVQPPDAPYPRPFKPLTVRFGRPVRPERYAARADDRRVWREMIDEVMFEIRELTGLDYVNEYATKASPAAGAETTPAAGPGEVHAATRRSSRDVLRQASSTA